MTDTARSNGWSGPAIWRRRDQEALEAGRLLIAVRDARFYIDLSPRVLPEDDDPPELLELEAALEGRRQRGPGIGALNGAHG